MEGFMAGLPQPQPQINPWLNTFDWGSTNSVGFNPIPLAPNGGWQVPDYTGTLFTMESPYHAGGSANYSYLAQPVNDFKERDFHWEDGWELLWLGTGYYPNGEKVNSANPNRIYPSAASVHASRAPYFILYNRYTGVMRLFINVFSPLGAYDNAHIEVSFESSTGNAQNLAGTLRLVNSYDQALDKPSSGILMGSQQAIPANLNQWMSADFQMAYDPCVCSFTSHLYFTISAWDAYDVNLYGRAVNVDVPIADANGNSTYDKDFLSVHDINNKSQSGGHVLYHKSENLVKDYQNRLQKYQQDLSDYKAYNNNILRKGLDAVVGYVSGGIVDYGKIAEILSVMGGDLGLTEPDAEATFSQSGLNAISSAFGPVPSGPFTDQQIDNGDAITDIRVDGDIVSMKKYEYGTLEKNLKKNGKKILGSGFDMLSLQLFGKKPDKPVKPTVPTATYSEMRFTGSISDTDDVVELGPFINPGSFASGQSLSPFNYPAYDEAMGLFAMLETPQIKVERGENLSGSRDIWAWDSYPNEAMGFPPESSGLPQDEMLEYEGFYIEESISLKLSEPIKYAFNDVLDIDEERTEVLVMLEVELNSFVDYDSRVYDYTKHFWEDDFVKFQHESSGNLSMRHAFSKGVSGKPDLHPNHPDIAANTRIYSTQWYDIEDFGERFFQLNLKTGWKDFLNYREPSFSPGNQLGYLLEHDVESIRLKVMVDMGFDQVGYQGRKNATTQVFTYNLYDQTLGIDDIEFDEELSSNAPYFPGSIVLQNEHINFNSPKLYQAVGNFFYVKAEKIQVNGNITVPAGKKLKLEAVDEVKVLASASLPAHTEIRINKNPYDFPTIVEQSPSQVSAFCSNEENGYAANRRVSKVEGISEAVPQETLSNNKGAGNTFSVYPNPATSTVFVRFDDSSDYLQVHLEDMAGRTFINQIVEGDLTKQFELDLQDLVPGIYFLSIHNPNGDRFSRKVIKE
jgi:hypothetical protein